jgi:itaconate CoA-transferase
VSSYASANALTLTTPLQSLVSASCLAAHLREDGGRRPHSRRAFDRQQPRQSASLGERLKKGEFEEAIGRGSKGRSRLRASTRTMSSPSSSANLKGLSSTERAHALIGLANPEFRDELAYSSNPETTAVC